MNHSTTVAPGDPALAQTMRKIIWRIVPLLFVCYGMNFLDRINVGFAQLQMKEQLGFADSVYGLGAGLFFLGYFFLEVPSNMLLEKIGARKTILRIMVLWGLTSAATMFVQTPMQFYIVRFFLGVFEAGFFPGILLYLTFWIPAAYRARVIAFLMSALVVTGILAGPVSGLILQHLDGVANLRGWQWMFLIEGLPCCLLGLIVFAWLDDQPADARWLSSAEKHVLAQAFEAGRSAQRDQSANTPSLRGAFTQPLVYLFAFVHFAIVAGGYLIAFWLPMIIRELGVANFLHIGLYSAIPYLLAGVAMILLGKSSDHFQERRLHVAVPAGAGALALVLLPQVTHSLALSLVLLSLATAGLYAALPTFWTVTTQSLTRAEAAAGIAIVVSLGNLSGFVSPYVIGQIRVATGSMDNGLYLLSSVVLLGCAALMLGTRSARRLTRVAQGYAP